MFGTDQFTGLFGKLNKKLTTISFAPVSTSVNPHKRNGTMPRLRHFKRVGPRRILMPPAVYSQKELRQQQMAVAAYHLRQKDQKNFNKQYNRIKKQQRHEMIIARREHKANKPVIVED